MTCEEAYAYLMKISWKIGTEATEVFGVTDRIIFREAVQTLYTNSVCPALEDEYELSQHNS